MVDKLPKLYFGIELPRAGSPSRAARGSASTRQAACGPYLGSLCIMPSKAANPRIFLSDRTASIRLSPHSTTHARTARAKKRPQSLWVLGAGGLQWAVAALSVRPHSDYARLWGRASAASGMQLLSPD